MQLEHFIFTRFNVRTDFTPGKHLDPAWLAKRFDLFKRYCHPSVIGQDCDKFRWILLVHPETPEPFRQALRDLGKVEIALAEDVRCSRLAALLATLMDPGTTHIITTRLDSDDAIARDFVSTLQEQGAGQRYLFMEFEQGAQLHDGAVYCMNCRGNPFMSLAEVRSDDIRTVFSKTHADAALDHRFKSIKTKVPMWVQVVHGGNARNRATCFELMANFDAARFGIQVS